ncbi:cytochrome b [Ancylobacter sp. IITR112]|uniref:cytochrome b n=1 Tax=Ancylobacter sp. IITR112 TaxID=3138073 RepID=UPI00352A0470
MDEQSGSIRKVGRQAGMVLIARPASGYSVLQRVLHWGVVLLCLAQIPTSWAIARTHMTHAFMQPAPFDLFLHRVHAWGGWLILAFGVARIGLRYLHGVPPLPAASSRIARWGPAVSHVLLYCLLFALPITGTAAMYVNSATFAPIHRLLTWSLLAVAVVHAVAALWHHLVRRDEVLRRMIVGVRIAK